MTASNLKQLGWMVAAVAVCTSVTFAGNAPPVTTQAETSTAPVVQCVQHAAAGFWPDLEWPTVCWLAAVVILAVTFRLRPLLSLRNLDGLVLAGTCLLLALRETSGNACCGPHTWQWWAYVGLTITAAYWLVRGIGWLLSPRPVSRVETAPNGARCVLLLVALALSIHRIATAPISSSSRDGIVGGLCTAATGKLPYGDAIEFESRSPLVYLVHAGAVRILEPTLVPAGEAIGRPMDWENRSWWLAEPWVESADLTAARLVNAVLFVVLLAGLCLIGTRWQASGSAWTMLAIFCVFPGTLECLAHPDTMLPATLLTWTLAFALLPGVGGLLATLCLVIAGFAWPWAWLGLPVLLAHFWRRGWHACGSVVGLLGGVAAGVLGAACLVQPAIPRANGALMLAGLQPLYTARLANPDTLVVDRRDVTSEEVASPALTRFVWRMLVDSDSAALTSAEQEPHAVKINWPNGINDRAVLYRQIAVAPAALPLLQSPYRKAVAQMPHAIRFVVAARTVLEATWVPAHVEEPAVTGAWQLWGGPPPATDRWVLSRRIVKAVAVLLVLWATLAVFVGRRIKPRHLLSTLLVAASGALLASETGAATNWVWLAPLVTALWTVHEPALPAAPPPAVPRSIPLSPLEPPPRITLDTGPAKPVS